MTLAGSVIGVLKSGSSGFELVFMVELVTYRVTGWFTILHSLPPLIKNVQEVLNLVIRHDRRVRLYITYYSSQSSNVVIPSPFLQH